MIRTCVLALVALAGAGLTVAATMGAEPAAKPAAVSDEEKKKLLDAETDAQKKLRAELSELAKTTPQRIFYNSNFEGRQRIYAVKPDGSDFTAITPKDWPEDAHGPHVSPDGKKIALVRAKKLSREEALTLPQDPRYAVKDGKRDVPGAAVWTMNVDGSDPKPVAMGGWPHWSPDGRYLNYCCDIKPNNRFFCLLDVEKKTEWIFRYKAPGTTCFSADSKYYVLGWVTFKIADIVGGEANPKPASNGGIGCNEEVTLDDKWLVEVRDYGGGSWLLRIPFDPTKPAGKREDLDLGQPKDTDNYFPDVNPDCKYMAYGHWKTGGGDKDRYSTATADIWACRWPPDGVTVRLTWHGGTTQCPHWWGPKAGTK